MKKVILQLAISLDGYIARKDGSVDFLSNMESTAAERFHAFLQDIDHIVMGSNTYETMLGFGDIPFEDKNIIVATRRTFDNKYPHVSFVDRKTDDIISTINGTIWLFGGAKMIQSFINKDLIDVYHLHIVPHIIGDGIPLFLKSKEVMNLELTEVEKLGNSVELVYKKAK